MLENLVHNELKRRRYEIYFHKNKKECDFLVKENLEITQAIQVCHSLVDIETKKREIQGLIDALDFYPHANALIITADDEQAEEIIEVDNKKYIFTILPIWKWLLEKNC